MKEFYSPSKGKTKVGGSGFTGTDKSDNSSSDSDFLPGNSCSSQDDEEAKEILKKFKEFKRKCKSMCKPN